MAAIGAGLFLCSFNWGMRIVEPLGLFLAMLCGFYALLRGAKAGWQQRSGPLAAVSGLLEDIAGAIGMVQGQARSIGAATGVTPGRQRDGVVLLKKGGDAYDSDETLTCPHEWNQFLSSGWPARIDADTRGTERPLLLLVAADADVGDTLTYSMASKDGDDSPLVTVDPTTGEVTLTTSQAGTDLQSLRFKAVVTDRSGLTDEREITVTLPAGSG